MMTHFDNVEPLDELDMLTAEDKESMYMDWVNNFLTVARFAEYYHVTPNLAKQLIEEARV